MTWVRTKIGDVITLQRGHDLPSSIRVPGDIPVISSSGITDYHNASKARGEGVVTGRYGTLGQVFYVNGQYWPLNTTLYVKDFKGNDPKFIYYFLQTLGLERFNGAAAVPGLDRNVIHRIDVQFNFHVPTQKKIASILSAYDDLIENNNQRIVLLEEMAEDIYKEWFVRMRFPGHEQCRWYDKEGNEVEKGTEGGLPEGWEMKMADDVFDINIGKTPPRDEPRWFTEGGDGVPWVSIKDMNASKVFITRTSEGITSEGMSKHNMRIAKAGTVLLSFKLTVGSIAIADVDMLSNEAIAHFNIKEGEEMNTSFIYWYLKCFQFGNLGNTSSIGSAINSKIVKAMPVLQPSNRCLDLFDAKVNPMMEMIHLLVKKNQVLQETRDLLLPRLISGKLSVDGLAEKEPRLAMAAEPEMVYGK